MVVLDDIMVETLKEYVDAVNDCPVGQDMLRAALQLASTVDVILRIGEKEDGENTNKSGAA